LHRSRLQGPHRILPGQDFLLPQHRPALSITRLKSPKIHQVFFRWQCKKFFCADSKSQNMRKRRYCHCESYFATKSSCYNSFCSDLYFDTYNYSDFSVDVAFDALRFCKARAEIENLIRKSTARKMTGTV